MQIQRIQTLYIFLSIIAMAIFVVVPYGEVIDLTADPQVSTSLYTMSEYGILIPAGAVIILLLTDMFLFRNMPLQRTVLVICLMLTLALIATVCFALYKQAGLIRLPRLRGLTLISACGISCSPSRLSLRSLL